MRNHYFRKWLQTCFSLLSISYNSTTRFVDPSHCQITHKLLNQQLQIVSPVCEKNHLLHTTVSVLVFGDSIDRLVVEDSCHLWGSNPSSWAVNFSYKVGAPADLLCDSRHGRLAFLNIYGSAQKGPYAHGHASSADDPYADTELRVAHGLDQFLQRFGTPDVVFYRSELWDLGAHMLLDGHNSSGCWPPVACSNTTRVFSADQLDQLFEEFIDNFLITIKYIRQRVPKSMICTHTVPDITFGMHLFPRYQNAVRFVADVAELCLFDWNKLLSPYSPTEYLRDFHHPNTTYTAAFGELLMSTFTNVCF